MLYFMLSQNRDLKDPRLDLIASATSFNIPEVDLAQMDADINAMCLKETRKKMLSHLTPLYLAVSMGDLDRVKMLIEAGVNPYDQDINENTVLHYAAESGELDILKYLLDEYECIPTKEGWHGSTILHSAASAGQLAIVRYLIEECQLDPSALEDSNSCSPLVYACRSGDIDTCCYLIDHMNETMSFKDIFSVQYYSETLKGSHPSVVNSDNFQRGPLTSACYYGHLGLVKYLIEKCSCDFSSTRSKIKA